MLEALLSVCSALSAKEYGRNAPQTKLIALSVVIAAVYAHGVTDDVQQQLSI